MRYGGNNRRAIVSYQYSSNTFTTASLLTYTIQGSPTVTDLGNGWKRLSITVNTSTDTSIVLSAGVHPTGAETGYTTDPTQGFYIANMVAP